MQAGGQRFESVILHIEKEHIDILEAEKRKPARVEVSKVNHEQIQNRRIQSKRGGAQAPQAE